MSILELLASEQRALSVGELTSQIRDLLEVEFFDIWVEGEISNFKRYSSGHWYFTLKDRQAQIRCAAFRNHNIYIRFRPEDGLKVRARGMISVYDQRGDYQLLVNTIEPVGKGALQLAFEQLKAQLLAEGYFDEERKRPLPRLPKRIGVVTSPKGAVIHDILNVLGRRNKSVDVLIYPVPVQGDGAAAEIAAAIDHFNTRTDIDVLIIARGGGSIEDLWAFNEESVAKAIFNSRLPIISAIGHETDFTIADFVADCRASTPSAAAEVVALHIDELSGHVSSCRESISSAFQYYLLKKRNDLGALRARRGFATLPSMLQRNSQQLDNLLHRLETTARLELHKKREALAGSAMRLATRDLKSSILANRNRLQKLEARMGMAISGNLGRASDRLSLGAGKLHALSPLAVLARGYALVRTESGKLIKNSSEVAPGDKVRVQLAEGEMTCIRDLE